jgi:3-hydroxyisobutyrate dehydrogenase-like beta-hydroxyacid dehydrogenase
VTPQPHIGFAGMGRMGQPMARRILAAGFPLAVTDVRAEACAPIVAAGATAVPTAAAVAERAAIVITCVPGPKEVEAVYFASDGILSTIAPGTIVLEMSTIDVALSRRVGAACAERACRYLDAPISGGVAGAVAGTLAVMVGGDAAALDDARALLESMAERIMHVGPTGAGHFTKLINQVMYLGYIALFCEATAAADAYGITRSDMVDVLRHSVGGTPLSTHWEERLLTGDPAPGFEIARVLKDLRLGAQAYADLPYDAPIFAAALAAYESAAANGHAGDDVTAVLQR